jgi:hypothetical protein
MSLQSFGRDFGSSSDTDYAILIQTKQRARELILQWIASDDEATESPPETTTNEPVPALA